MDQLVCIWEMVMVITSRPYIEFSGHTVIEYKRPALFYDNINHNREKIMEKSHVAHMNKRIDRGPFMIIYNIIRLQIYD